MIDRSNQVPVENETVPQNRLLQNGTFGLKPTYFLKFYNLRSKERS